MTGIPRAPFPRAAALGVLAAALAAGCATPTGGPGPGTVVLVPPAATTPLNSSDRAFAAQASGNGLYEVEVARLAAGRAADPRVRAYARMLVDHHGLANNELMGLIRAHNLPPPAMPAEKRERLQRLAAMGGGGEFDREFVRVVGIDDHMSDIALFEAQAREGNDPALKAWAARTLPALRAHLDAARAYATGR